MVSTDARVAETPSLDEVMRTWLPTKVAAQGAGISDRYMALLAATGKLVAVTTPLGRLIEPTQLAAYAALHRQRYKMREYLARKEGAKGGTDVRANDAQEVR